MGLDQYIYAISETGERKTLLRERNNYKLRNCFDYFLVDQEIELSLEDLNELKAKYYDECDEYDMFEDYKNESIMYGIINGKRLLNEGYKIFYSYS